MTVDTETEAGLVALEKAIRELYEMPWQVLEVKDTYGTSIVVTNLEQDTIADCGVITPQSSNLRSLDAITKRTNTAKFIAHAPATILRLIEKVRGKS